MLKFGLLGEHLSHSYSKIIHEKSFADLGVCASYDLLEIKKEEIPAYLNMLRRQEYAGFNVTIPYKEEVIKYLDALSPEASEIGAVNTVVFNNGMLVGYNTDCLGFKEELDLYKIDIANKNVFVLGDGGASKAICYILKKLNAKLTIISLFPDKEKISYDQIKNYSSFDILINTTPVGMYPHTDESILTEEIIKRADIVIDVIFNPKVTKFMSYGNKSYNGLAMLISQAIHSERIWLKKEIAFSKENILEYEDLIYPKEVR